MPGVVPEIGSSALRLWVAAGSAALLVALCAMAYGWAQTKNLARLGVVALGAVLGATMAWAFLNGATTRDQDAERRALEARASELNVQTLAPGSALACLDGLAGENVEVACEKALFANPATVASAASYAAARLALLADMTTYSKHGGDDIDGVIQSLRHSLETDRYGFVAHALATRDGCTSQNCQALALLHDSSKVRANLSGQTLNRYLDHYLTVWSQTPDGSPANLTSATPGAPGAPGERKVMVNIDFPSAASIPPVSIMNPEPPRPAAAAAAVPGEGAHPAPVAKPRKGKAAPQTASAPPAETAPPVDPVWIPTTASTAPQPPAAAPQPQAATPAVTAPVQLNPFPPPPQAAASGTQPTQ